MDADAHIVTNSPGANGSLWSKTVRAFSQQKERPMQGSADQETVPLETLPEGVVKIISKPPDDDFVGPKGGKEVVHAMTSPVALWNNVIRSISQQKERPSPKSVTEPLETLPEHTVKTAPSKDASARNAPSSRVSSYNKGTAKSISNSKLSSTPSNNDSLDEDMSIDESTGLVSRSSTTDAKKSLRNSSFASNRNARFKPNTPAPAEPPSLSGKGDEKTRAFLGSSSAFESSNLQIQNLAATFFDKKKNLTEEEIRNLLNLRVSTKDMTPEQQMNAANKLIKRLKDTLSDLAKAKTDFIAQATIAERNARNGWSDTLEIAQLLDEERTYFKRKLKQMETDNNIWKDNAKDSMRELSVVEDKLQTQQDEIELLRKKVLDAEAAATQAKIALQVEKARIQDMEKNYSRNDVNAVSISNLEFVKAQVRKDTEKELRQTIQAEKLSLRDEVRRCETRIRSLESQLSLGETQLARAVAEAEGANARAKAKDNDMIELMKSIKDIQNAGHNREENLNKVKREAEVKVHELEKSLATSEGTINLLTHEKITLKESLDTVKQERDDVIKDLNDVRKDYDELKNSFNSEKSQVTLERELRLRSEQKEHEERSERIALSAQMVAMTKEYAQMEAQLKDASTFEEVKWRKLMESQEEKLKAKEDELKAALEEHMAFQVQIDALKQSLHTEKTVALADTAEEMSKLKGELRVLQERMKVEGEKNASLDTANMKKIKELESQIQESQAERRRLHNVIQELRGNVRVFARIRPFLPDDKVNDDDQPCILPRSESALKLVTNEDRQKYDFNFDRVFSPAIGQEAIFTEVSEFVQSALDGYNVCLFSYGQTGSGKTYTMQGYGTGQMRGIIPRAIEQVGNYKQQLEKDGWQYDMQVSFLEIYNESIRDLLREEGSELLKHDIKVDAEGRRFVSDLTMVPLEPTDKDAVEAVMRQAAKHRAVGSTDMNATSSRSHSVFTLHLTAFHPTQRQALRGTLNLVDLAGSERLSRSNASGDRAKETVAINKSLSALTDVFVAIGQKASHIPFRNSKLTYLLQPSLSGDGKTLMMVNLSPTEMSAQESLCSLRFAAQVNKCELGKAKRSLEDLDEDDAATFASEIGSRSSAPKTPLVKAASGVSSSSSDISKVRRSAVISPSSAATPKNKVSVARSTSMVDSRK